MGNAALELGVSFTSIGCHNCGGTYALAANFARKRREDGGNWHCPYCEAGTVFGGSSEVDRLKKQLESERKRREWAQKGRDRAQREAEHQKKRAAGYKGAFTKAKKRVGKGVCPCCNRHFSDLQRHMETKHPDYSETEPEVEADSGGICGATTMDGGSCGRTVADPSYRCWQHRD